MNLIIQTKKQIINKYLYIFVVENIQNNIFNNRIVKISYVLIKTH